MTLPAATMRSNGPSVAGEMAARSGRLNGLGASRPARLAPTEYVQVGEVGEVGQVGEDPADGGGPVSGHLEHRGVGVDPDAPVAQLRQPDGHPTGAAACIQDSGLGGHQPVAERRLAVHVDSGGGELREPVRVTPARPACGE